MRVLTLRLSGAGNVISSARSVSPLPSCCASGNSRRDTSRPAPRRNDSTSKRCSGGRPGIPVPHRHAQEGPRVRQGAAMPKSRTRAGKPADRNRPAGCGDAQSAGRCRARRPLARLPAPVPKSRGPGGRPSRRPRRRARLSACGRPPPPRGARCRGRGSRQTKDGAAEGNGGLARRLAFPPCAVGLRHRFSVPESAHVAGLQLRRIRGAFRCLQRGERVGMSRIYRINIMNAASTRTFNALSPAMQLGRHQRSGMSASGSRGLELRAAPAGLPRDGGTGAASGLGCAVPPPGLQCTPATTGCR